MELTSFIAFAFLLLNCMLLKLSYKVQALPIITDAELYGADRLDYSPSNDDDYYVAYGRPLTDKSLNKLQRGYYYVDHGYISPVATDSNIRRQDAPNLNVKGVRYTPVVRYKETRTKRKKLFVPNFFG